MLKAILILIALTFIPGLELRASIPVGAFKYNDILPIWLTVMVCIVSNVLIGWLVFSLITPCANLFRKISWIDKLFTKYLERAQRKLKPQVDKYGALGLAFFIGIPLPGTGAYTGAAGAFALGMNRRQFAMANVIGVCIAGIAVTIIVLLIRAGVESPLFDFLIKR